ncbi:MAG: flagellar biosynthesis anti-sigma factor FlgM [Candidatus Subteraquimicrobiales bacterium]|nr:flagellar biosynthesis anti-sigma factor FlgM [Candidatus Subteraquimicrobiales bacterium]
MREKDRKEEINYISEERGALRQCRRVSYFDAKKIEEIRRRLEDGTYVVPVSDVAERLMSHLFLVDVDFLTRDDI